MVTMLLKMVATVHCLKRGLSQTQSSTLSPFRKVTQTRRFYDTHTLSVNSLGASLPSLAEQKLCDRGS